MRYGTVALLGVIAGSLLGALVCSVALMSQIAAGDQVARELLPIGLAVAAVAGSLLAAVAELAAAASVIVHERYGAEGRDRRARAAAVGAACGVATSAIGVWLIAGAEMLVPVPALLLAAGLAVLAAWAAWAGVLHVEQRREKHLHGVSA